MGGIFKEQKLFVKDKKLYITQCYFYTHRGFRGKKPKVEKADCIKEDDSDSELIDEETEERVKWCDNRGKWSKCLRRPRDFDLKDKNKLSEYRDNRPKR